MSELDDVDLVEIDGYMLIVYVDDAYYRDCVPQVARHKSLYDLANFKQKVSSRAVVWDIKNDPFHFVVSEYARAFDDFVFCDIGAHYGVTTMDSLLVARANGARPRAFAFDPGKASNLTMRNFENNSFEVTFEQAAVGAVDGHAVLAFDPSTTTNDRLVNTSGRTAPVRCLRLDTYLRNRTPLLPICAKIDTQGAEPSVIAGMHGLLRDVPVAVKMEFTPWAMRQSGVNPVTFADDLLASHVLFDLGHSNNRLVEIASGDQVVVAADSAWPHWCDVLALPRACALLAATVARLQSESGAADS